MVSRNFGRISGIMIDVCRHHGVWLDAKELEAIVEFIRKGGLEKSRDLGFGKVTLDSTKTAQDWALSSSSSESHRDRKPPNLYHTLSDAVEAFLELFR